MNCEKKTPQLQPKTLKIAFTGNVILTPDYPTTCQPITGPMQAIMPGARRRRRSFFPNDQIDAQFAFLMFPFRHLLADSMDDRGADYKYPDTRDVRTGLCILERELLVIETPPIEQMLEFDDSSEGNFPTKASTSIRSAARWRDFADEGYAVIRPDAFGNALDLVRVSIPAGFVSAGFVSEPIARLDFDYGESPRELPYAQEIVITLTFDEAVPYVILRSYPFDDGPPPPFVRLDWFDAREIKILFGNGSLSSIHSALQGSFAGHDHEGDYDLEFEVLYDVIDCNDDANGTVPIPKIVSNEILRVPCVATMVGSSDDQVETAQASRRSTRAAATSRATGTARQSRTSRSQASGTAETEIDVNPRTTTDMRRERRAARMRRNR